METLQIPRQTAKNQLAVALVLTDSKSGPGLMSFIGQMLPIIWAVRCQFDVLDSSCSSSRAAELTPPKILPHPPFYSLGNERDRLSDLPRPSRERYFLLVFCDFDLPLEPFTNRICQC